MVWIDRVLIKISYNLDFLAVTYLVTSNVRIKFRFPGLIYVYPLCKDYVPNLITIFSYPKIRGLYIV